VGPGPASSMARTCISGEALRAEAGAAWHGDGEAWGRARRALALPVPWRRRSGA